VQLIKVPPPTQETCFYTMHLTGDISFLFFPEMRECSAHARREVPF
jgi:hypothetical protein